VTHGPELRVQLERLRQQVEHLHLAADGARLAADGAYWKGKLDESELMLRGFGLLLIGEDAGAWVRHLAALRQHELAELRLRAERAELRLAEMELAAAAAAVERQE